MIKAVYKLLTVVLVFLLACDKAPFNDLSGEGILKGTLVLTDTMNGTVLGTVLKNHPVYLKYSGDNSGFLNSTTSNSQGAYTFSGIDTKLSYTVYASVDTGAVKYAGSISYTAGQFTGKESDTLRLYPSSHNQNGIHLTVRDNQGARVAFVTAWVYNSRQLFDADTSAGKVFDMVTNENGISNKYNIGAGKYFVRIKTKIGAFQFAGTDSVVVEEKGISNLVMTVNRIPQPAPVNGFELTILDDQQTPVQNAQTYIYRSRSVFLADTASLSNSLYKISSNAAGLAVQYNIDAAKYYLRNIKEVSDKVRFESVDSVTVGVTGVEKKTIIME